MAENMHYHDGSPYDERMVLDQKVRLLMLEYHRERITDDSSSRSPIRTAHMPHHEEYMHTPTRGVTQERIHIETQRRSLQRVGEEGFPIDSLPVSFQSNNDHNHHFSNSPLRNAQHHQQSSLLPNYRNRLVQHEVRRLRRQARRQAGTASEPVSSPSSSASSMNNIQPSQVKLIKEDRRRNRKDVNNNCTAKKIGITDIATATSSLSSSKVFEEESSQQLREYLIRARFRIHTSRALLASHSMDSADCQVKEEKTNSVSHKHVSPSRKKTNNLLAPSTPPSKTSLLRGRYEDINLAPEQRCRKSSMVGPGFSTTRSRSFGLSDYDDLQDKWAQDTGDLPSLSTTHNPSSPSHRCANNGMTVMQDGSIRRAVVNKGRSRSMKTEPEVSPSVTRSFAFDPFPSSTSSENTLWDNDTAWTAPSYTPGSLFNLFNECQKDDDETQSHQLLEREVRDISEDDLCNKVTVNASNVVRPITKITVVTTTTTTTTNSSSSSVRSKSIKWNVLKTLSERRIPLICRQNSQDCSSSSDNEPRSLSTDQTSSRSSSSCGNPASTVNRGKVSSVRKGEESSRRHRNRSSISISGNTDHQDQDLKKSAVVTRNLVTPCSKSKTDNKEWLRSANASEGHVQPRSYYNRMEMVFYDETQEDKNDNEQQQ
jgi:hypothetical protein